MYFKKLDPWPPSFENGEWMQTNHIRKLNMIHMHTYNFADKFFLKTFDCSSEVLEK